MSIKLELPEDAVKFIVQMLGDLPSRTGAFIILKQIEHQVQEQAEQKPE